MNRGRLLAVAVVLSAAMIVLGGRLYLLQIVRHEESVASARRMHGSFEVIPTYRGTIRSKGGVILARDVLDYEIGVDPTHLPEDKLQRIVRLVCDSLGKPSEYRRDRLRVALARKEAGGRYVHLVSRVSASTVEEIRNAVSAFSSKDERRGFVVRMRAHRTYPRGGLANAVVGVVDAENVGREGVERSLQPYLSGREGQRNLILDATRRTLIFNLANAEVAPVRGYDVYLTIDPRLQAIVEAELEAGIRRERAEGGTFVLMDCNTGDILAMASWPDYDPNHFGDYPDQERKRRRANKAIEDLYETGSVMKPFFAAYAIERGICGRDQLVRSLAGEPIVWDGGRLARFGRRVVSDVHAHEDLTLERSIIYSSNICLGILGHHLGRERIYDLLDRFGFCVPTGIDLPAEAAGKRTAPEAWKPLYSSVSVSFGYEIMVSPLQLTRAFAAVVNGGYLLRPRIVEKVVRDGEERLFPPRQVLGRAIGEEASRQMREILHRVVEEGTGKWLKIEGFDFGGKTGTADMARGGYTKSDYLASFESFAPASEPEVVAVCMIEKPRGGSIYGAMVAGPIVAEVYRRMYQLKGETRLAKLRKAAGR